MTLKIELKEQKLQPTLSIRTRTTLEELPNKIKESYIKIANYLNELGEKPTNAPFTAYYNLDMQDMDVEMGFPVVKALPGKDDVLAGEIPAGYVVSCLYKGAYSGMESVYNDMFNWIARNNYKSTGIYYEYYFNSPAEASENELLTRIDLPVEISNRN